MENMYGTRDGCFDFEFKYLSDWEINIDGDDMFTEVVLSKGVLKLFIKQGQIGGGRCVFPDEPDYNSEIEGPHGKNGDFVQFIGIEGTYRRTKYADASSSDPYHVCIKLPGNSDYASPPLYGLVEYHVPADASKADLSEMDEIVKSISSI